MLLSLGVRFGEAANPGPVQFVTAVRNVVSAAKHMDELPNSFDAVMWSETSATATTQNSIKHLAQKHRSYCSFSAPRAPRTVKGIAATGREKHLVRCFSLVAISSSLWRVPGILLFGLQVGFVIVWSL